MNVFHGERETKESYMNRKFRRIERFNNLQLIPLFCKIAFICMLIFPPVAAISDAVSFLRYGTDLGLSHLFQNLCITLFGTWLMFAVILIPCSVYQLYRFRHGYIEKQPEPRSPKDVPDNRRYDESVYVAPKPKTNDQIKAKYHVYCLISGVGLVIFAFGCIISSQI